MADRRREGAEGVEHAIVVECVSTEQPHSDRLIGELGDLAEAGDRSSDVEFGRRDRGADDRETEVDPAAYVPGIGTQAVVDDRRGRAGRKCEAALGKGVGGDVGSVGADVDAEGAGVAAVGDAVGLAVVSAVGLSVGLGDGANVAPGGNGVGGGVGSVGADVAMEGASVSCVGATLSEDGLGAGVRTSGPGMIPGPPVGGRRATGAVVATPDMKFIPV